ncbi:MAG: hypothetical protein FVQ80_15850 [Planctomycetes bacterium]|nr:hypothetical protein [Planctomycetota bacterium]
MQKFLALLLILSPYLGFSEGIKLPVFTTRYEIAYGTEEDEDEGSLIPSYLRHTAFFRVKEEFSDKFSSSLQLRYSQKDYFSTGSDYSYIYLNPAVDLELTDKLGLDFGLFSKWTWFNDLDGSGLSKDLFSFGARVETGYKIKKGLKISSFLKGLFNIYDNPEKRRQDYSLGIGVTARMGEFLFGARYRGVARFPLGSASSKLQDFYNLGALSLTWDPNK